MILKRLLLLLFVIAIKMAAVAQTTTLPMIVEGRTWNVMTINPADPSETNNGYYDILGRRGKVWNRISYVLEGDTIIDGVSYKRLLSDRKFVCGLREEEGRVYGHGWGWNPDSEALVYDFNAQPGDVFKNDDENIMVQVKRVRQVNINGLSRRCLEMHHYDVDEKGERYNGFFADYWIEGIGCTGYMHNPFWWEVIGNYPLLLSCYDGEECIFNIEDFNGIVTAIKDTPEAVHRHSIDSDTPIFNLDGQKVNNSYKGVVIQDGKKRITGTGF